MAAAAGVAIAGGVVAGVTSAIAQRRSAYQQASILDSQAYEEQRQAQITRLAGVEAVRQIGKQAVMLRGKQEEGYAAGGVVSNTGSALEVAQEDAREMKFNQLKTQFKYDSQAYSLDRKAQLDSWAAGKTRQAGNLAMAMGLLTTFTGASRSYSAGQTLGGGWRGNGFGVENSSGGDGATESVAATSGAE